MIHFTCPRCNAEYQYPDDMAGNKIRCAGPNCNQKLLVPSPAVLTAPTASVAPGLPQWVNDQLVVPVAPIMPAAPTVPVAPSARLWNYLENGRAKGPVAASELRRLVADGRLKPRDAVWSAGMSEWRPMHEALPEMFRKPAAAVRPRPPSATKKAAENDKRGGLFEKIGIGVFAIVAAVILGGLFALLVFPLMHFSAAQMKPEEVAAKVMPSVALVENRDGSGSGFLVDGGFVVTNAHVVTGDTIAGLAVRFPSSDHKDQKYKVRLAYEDRTRDIAILQVQDPPALPPLRLSSAKLAAGEDVLAIGSPGVKQIEGGVSPNSADKGTLGNPNFHSTEFNEAKIDLQYIQHSAKINHGNSGGPLLDMRADVIGVNEIALDAEGLDGMKLAIPADELRDVLAKAAARNADQIDHAIATHDAYNMAQKLEQTLLCYHLASQHCVDAAIDAEKDPSEAYNAAHDAIAAGRVKFSDGKRFPDPVVYRQKQLDEPQMAEINNLLSGSSLEDRVRGELRQLQDMYFQVQRLYEAPSGTFGDMKEQLNKMADEFPKLKQRIDREFGFVF